jgi:hypothetical protein
MKTRFTAAIAAAVCCAALAFVLPSALAAQRGEPCCTVKSINARTRMVTITETKTGCTYDVQAKTAKDVEGLKAGSSFDIDVKGLAFSSGPTQSTGQAATSGTGRCGSNVPRDADTKACYEIKDGKKVVVRC